MPAWIPYCGSAPDPADTWARWNFGPELVLVIFALKLFSIAPSKVRLGMIGLIIKEKDKI